MGSRYDPKRAGVGKYLHTVTSTILVDLYRAAGRRDLPGIGTGLAGPDGEDADASLRAICPDATDDAQDIADVIHVVAERVAAELADEDGPDDVYARVAMALEMRSVDALPPAMRRRVRAALEGQAPPEPLVLTVPEPLGPEPEVVLPVFLVVVPGEQLELFGWRPAVCKGFRSAA